MLAESRREKKKWPKEVDEEQNRNKVNRRTKIIITRNLWIERMKENQFTQDGIKIKIRFKRIKFYRDELTYECVTHILGQSKYKCKREGMIKFFFYFFCFVLGFRNRYNGESNRAETC